MVALVLVSAVLGAEVVAVTLHFLVLVVLAAALFALHQLYLLLVFLDPKCQASVGREGAGRKGYRSLSPGWRMSERSH